MKKIIIMLLALLAIGIVSADTLVTIHTDVQSTITYDKNFPNQFTGDEWYNPEMLDIGSYTVHIQYMSIEGIMVTFDDTFWIYDNTPRLDLEYNFITAKPDPGTPINQ